MALAIMGIIFAAIVPQFGLILHSWESKRANAEVIQNGRILTDHLERNLSKAVLITAVSGPSETNGYIEFKDNGGSTLRYDIDAGNYVEFGTVGDLSDLAGPVSQLQFTCYDPCDLDTPITDVGQIRCVKVQTTLTNPSATGQDKTFTAQAYLRTNCSLRTNLVGHWRLDETSGLTAVDSSRFGNDGTLTNMVGNEWTAGPVEGALAFDGTNDYIDVSSLSATTDKTFSCWIYINSLTANFHTLIEFGDDAPWFGLAEWLGNWYLREYQMDCWGKTILSTGQWYHIVYTSNSGTNSSKVYLNGVEDTEFAANANTQTGSGMGIAYHNGNTCFNGIIDDVRLYNRALSATEIAALAETLSFKEFTEAKASSDTTSITISTPADTNEGDLLIAAVATDGGTALSLAPPGGEGWTEIDVGAYGSEVTLGAWWKNADASESPSHQFTWSGSEQAYAWMMRFTGHDTGNPINVSATDGETSSTPTSPAVTTTVDDCIILRLGGFDDGDITVDDPGLSGHTAITMDSSSGGMTYQEFTEKKESAGGTSLTIDTPAGTSEDDLLIAAVATESDTSGSLAPPGGEGWTEIDIGQRDGRVTLGVWWKLADASESSTHQFTWGASKQAYGWIMRFTGHHLTSTIDDMAATGGKSGTPESPAVTTTVANAVILRIGGFKDDDITVDDPGLSGHTAITMDYSKSGGKCSGGAGYKIQAAIGSSGTSNFSLAASKEYRAVTIAIAPDPGNEPVSGGAGYVKQSAAGDSGTSTFALTASQESRTITIAIAPPDTGDEIFP